VAIEVWSKRGAFYYLRYCLNRHMDFPATVQAIRLVKKLFPETMYILIEDKANGSAIIQTLRQEFIGVIAINPKGGKVARVNAVSPAIESGNVFLPNDTLWAEEFVDQFTVFPAGKHDDMVDSASQALTYLVYSSGIVDVPELPESEQFVQREEKAFLDNDTLFNPYEEETAWQRLSSPAR
jgi:predicted phage terminase large subunit-like protein